MTYSQSDLIDVATNVNIKWLNSSNHTLHSYTGLNDYTEHTLSYTISNVKLYEAGQYTCSVFINAITNNPFILTSDRMTDVVTVLINSKSFLNYYYDIIFFSVPNDIIDSTTAVNPATSYYEVGSDVTLTCSIRYVKSAYIDVSTRVHIKWIHVERILANAVLHENTSHNLQYTVHILKLSQTGQYKCLYFIDTAVPNSYINPSVNKSNVVNITAISK